MFGGLYAISEKNPETSINKGFLDFFMWSLLNFL